MNRTVGRPIFGTYNGEVRFALRPVALIAAAAVTLGIEAGVGAQTPVPRPSPFPGSSTAPSAPVPPQPAAPPRTEPAADLPAAPAEPSPPEAALGGAPIYPAARFLESFDAGRGQRYYIYGTNVSYEEIVAYYRNVLRDGGRELYRTPPTRQFELGRFNDNRMAYPPSIVVKDYTWNGSDGYLFADGTTETRFRTIIQIVPPDAVP